MSGVRHCLAPGHCAGQPFATSATLKRRQTPERIDYRRFVDRLGKDDGRRITWDASVGRAGNEHHWNIPMGRDDALNRQWARPFVKPDIGNEHLRTMLSSRIDGGSFGIRLSDRCRTRTLDHAHDVIGDQPVILDHKHVAHL